MTVLGIILLIVGFLAFLLSRKWLYILLIISAPFSATSVLNLGDGANASGIQAWMYFGVLWLLSEMSHWLLAPDARFAISLLKRSSLLAGFVLILAASLIMPLYIQGRLLIEAPGLLDFSTTPLFFSARNITSLLYIIFGAFLAISIARRNMDEKHAVLTEKAWLAAGMITCALGALEFIAHAFNVPPPTLLFRNSSSPYALGNLGYLDGNLTRISSVAVESSILAQFLVSVIPLTIPALLGKGYVFSKKKDRIGFLFLIVILCLSTSSVAYATLIASPILCLPVILRLGIKVRKAFLYTMLAYSVVAFGAGALYLVFPTARQVLVAALFAKSESYSALERFKTISAAWEYFRDYPILGVGWGSVTSHDVVAMILANSGMLGLLAFTLAMVGIARPLFLSIDKSLSPVALSRAVWLLSGVLLMFASVISEFPFVFGHFWIVVGMGIAASTANYRQTVTEPANALNDTQVLSG